MENPKFLYEYGKCTFIVLTGKLYTYQAIFIKDEFLKFLKTK